MSNAKRPSIEEVLARVDVIIAAPEADLARDAGAMAPDLLVMGEAILDAWLEAKDLVPTTDKTEGFRLLAQHRQAARGNPSFNACRETCREVVYHHNLVLHDVAAPDVARNLRLGAMVVRHLALFVGGKLEADGLGDFCCSSRPVRQADTFESNSETA